MLSDARRYPVDRHLDSGLTGGLTALPGRRRGQRGQLVLLEGSAADLLGLVNELLDLAKAELGRLEPRWGTVDLPGLFGALRGTMWLIGRSPEMAGPVPTRPGAARAEVEVVVEEPEGLPPLRTDQSMLTQVLRNLMTDAIKFTPHGEVRPAARAVGDRSAFTVTLPLAPPREAV